MRLWILGSGTLRPDPLRGSPGYWIEVDGARILLDCGSGTLRTLARQRRDWAGVTHVLLSHFHTDHVADLAPLLFALKHASEPRREAPLTIAGPRGIGGHLEALAGAHGGFILNPGFPVQVVELSPEGPWFDPGGGFRLDSYATEHADPSLAFRLESGGVTLGYSGDTGPDPCLGDFLGGSELLVAECSHDDERATSNHLSPKSLADLASRARPELLIPVHAYPPLRPENIPPLLRSRGYEGAVLVGRDGLVAILRRGSVEVEES